METDTLYISDYISNSKYSSDLGIYFYKDRVFYLSGVEDKVKSYNFILGAAKSKKDFYTNKIEVFEFIATLNLKDYSYKKLNSFKYKHLEFDHIKIDFLKIIKDHRPDLLSFLESRLSFYENTMIPKDIILINDIEFLEFDHTADLLAVPYKYNNKLGCHVYLQAIKHDKSFLDRFFNFLCIEQIKEYLLPYHLRQLNFDNLPDNKKIIALLNFDKVDQVAIYKKFYKNFINDENINFYLSDYKIIIYGNDDISYSKYFLSKEDAENELLFLRKRQPLNMYKDIFEKEYFFTN